MSEDIQSKGIRRVTPDELKKAIRTAFNSGLDHARKTGQVDESVILMSLESALPKPTKPVKIGYSAKHHILVLGMGSGSYRYIAIGKNIESFFMTAFFDRNSYSSVLSREKRGYIGWDELYEAWTEGGYKSGKEGKMQFMKFKKQIKDGICRIHKRCTEELGFSYSLFSWDREVVKLEI